MGLDTRRANRRSVLITDVRISGADCITGIIRTCCSYVCYNDCQCCHGCIEIDGATRIANASVSLSVPVVVMGLSFLEGGPIMYRSCLSVHPSVCPVPTSFYVSVSVREP